VLAQLRSAARALFRRAEFERSMADEMHFHIEAYAADLLRAGLAPDEAQRQARIAFGPVGALQEDCRQARGARAVDELRQDLRYAARQLVRSPGFTAAAVLSLALGIGANSAIFSLIDAVLYRTLPVSNPDRLFFLAHGSGDDVSPASNYPLLERYRSSGLFASVTASSQTTFTVTGPEGLERVEGQYASGNYHSTLGVAFVLGRGFADEPDRPDGRSPTAVISDAYWARRFARSPAVIGKTLSIGGRVVTIIGVTAPGFHGVIPGYRADITLPLSLRAIDDPAFLTARDRWISLRLIARLRPDRTLAHSQAAASDLFRRYWSEPENERSPNDVRLGTLLPAGRGSDELRERYGTPLRLLLAMVGIVLLIACANVANVSFARGTERAKEVAVRLSMGASRARLVRQMLTESTLLAMLGGGLGVLVASLSTRLITSAFAVGETPLLVDARMNWRVLAFTGAVSMLASVLVGLAPALRSSNVDVAPTLKDSARLERLGRFSIGRVLVIAQFALSVVVVCVAALLARSVLNMKTFDAGFTRENTTLFNVDAGASSMTPERRALFFDALAARLGTLPGVSAVAYAQRSPLDHSVQTRPIEVPGATIAKELAGVSANVVTPEFFQVFGIRVVRGRGLSDADRIGAEPAAVVDESLVRQYFGAADPLGSRVLLGGDRDPFTIVGVVRSGRFESVRDEPMRTIYTAVAQSKLGSREQTGDVRRITVAVRTKSDPARLGSMVRGEVAALSRDVTVSYVRTMEQQMDAALLRERLMARLSAGYATLALLLSVVGLYGVTSIGVARRTRDIGIRMALGATRRRVLSAILRETLATSVIGIALGVVGAMAATRLVATFLFGVAPRDAVTLGAVVALLSVTALVAGLVPARRAAFIDPACALRGQ
jgi:predicted permease